MLADYGGDVVSTSGTTCLLDANISGGVSVPPGAIVDIEHSTVAGSISANAPGAVIIANNPCGGAVIGNSIIGSWVIIGNNPPITAAGNHH